MTSSGDDSSQVVRSVILTRSGLEESARAGAPVQDMVRGVPADLFRTCLARVSTFFYPDKSAAQEMLFGKA